MQEGITPVTEGHNHSQQLHHWGSYRHNQPQEEVAQQRNPPAVTQPATSTA